MSSLQKFHRRTNNISAISAFTTIGAGNDTVGYWLSGTVGNKLIVAPKSTEYTALNYKWGGFNIIRNTTSTTDGLTNTNTLHSYGVHPAATYCKTLATGGYNTWYLPAAGELVSLFTARKATPFFTNNGFTGQGGYNPSMVSSTEASGGYAAIRFMWVSMLDTGGTIYDGNLSQPKDSTSKNLCIRAVRRTTTA